MSILPEQETDVDALLEAGYTVTYAEYGWENCDNIDGRVSMFDAVREVVRNQEGEVDAPEDLPSVKYFDKESGKLFAALWIK